MYQVYRLYSWEFNGARMSEAKSRLAYELVTYRSETRGPVSIGGKLFPFVYTLERAVVGFPKKLVNLYV